MCYVGEPPNWVPLQTRNQRGCADVIRLDGITASLTPTAIISDVLGPTDPTHYPPKDSVLEDVSTAIVKEISFNFNVTAMSDLWSDQDRQPRCSLRDPFVLQGLSIGDHFITSWYDLDYCYQRTPTCKHVEIRVMCLQTLV